MRTEPTPRIERAIDPEPDRAIREAERRDEGGRIETSQGKSNAEHR